MTATATATASPCVPPTSAAPRPRAAGNHSTRAAVDVPRYSAAVAHQNSRRSRSRSRRKKDGTSPPAARRVPSPTSAGAASGPTRPGGWRSAGTGTSRAAAGSRTHQDSCPSHNQSTQVSQQQLATAAAGARCATSSSGAGPRRPRPPKTPPAWRRRAGSAPFLVSTTSRARRAARRRPAQIFVEAAAGSGPGGCRSAGPPY